MRRAHRRESHAIGAPELLQNIRTNAQQLPYCQVAGESNSVIEVGGVPIGGGIKAFAFAVPSEESFGDVNPSPLGEARLEIRNWRFHSLSLENSYVENAFHSRQPHWSDRCFCRTPHLQSARWLHSGHRRHSRLPSPVLRR